MSLCLLLNVILKSTSAQKAIQLNIINNTLTVLIQTLHSKKYVYSKTMQKMVRVKNTKNTKIAALWKVYFVHDETQFQAAVSLLLCFTAAREFNVFLSAYGRNEEAAADTFITGVATCDIYSGRHQERHKQHSSFLLLPSSPFLSHTQLSHIKNHCENAWELSLLAQNNLGLFRRAVDRNRLINKHRFIWH